jgi:hypothetical protein
MFGVIDYTMKDNLGTEQIHLTRYVRLERVKKRATWSIKTGTARARATLR